MAQPRSLLEPCEWLVAWPGCQHYTAIPVPWDILAPPTPGQLLGPVISSDWFVVCLPWWGLPGICCEGVVTCRGARHVPVTHADGTKQEALVAA